MNSFGSVTEHQTGPAQRFVQLSPGEAVRRHPVVFVLPIIVLVAAAAGLGLNRPPVYTSETRLTVGGLDLSSPGALSGLSTASESLSESYSRSVDAEQVVDPVAKKLGVPATEVRSSVTATPVPNSPVFRVQSKAASAALARDLANQTASSLSTYVGTLSAQGPRSDRIFKQYRRAAGGLSRAEDQVGELRGSTDRGAVAAAKGRVQAAKLRLRALQQSYVTSVGSQSTSPGAQQLAKARSTISDRNPRLQIYLFVGLVAGAVLGIVLALFVANREARRRLVHA